MASKSNLPKTSGTFTVRGIVSGVNSDGFFKEETVTVKRNGVDTPVVRRSLRFSVQTSPANRVTLTMNEFKPDTVYFYKKGDKGQKGVSKAVPYAESRKFNEEGFQVIGTQCGLEQTYDVVKKKSMNKQVHLCNYDAIEYIKTQLTDGVTVYVRGNVNNYRGKDGKLYTSYIPTQVSMAMPLDLDKIKEDPTKEVAQFNQKIIYQGIEKDESSTGGKSTYIINATLLDFGGKTTDISYYCYIDSLAKNLRKLNAYTAIDVEGHIENRVVEKQVDDSWGISRATTNEYDRRLVIDFADKDSIDTDTYSEEAIQALTRANQEYGSPLVDDDDDLWG